MEFIRLLLNDISFKKNRNKNIGYYRELNFQNNNKFILCSEYEKFYKSRENSFIVDIFYNLIINTFTCKCGYQTYTFEMMLDIPLILKYTDNNDLYDLLKNNE